MPKLHGISLPPRKEILSILAKDYLKTEIELFL